MFAPDGITSKIFDDTQTCFFDLTMPWDQFLTYQCDTSQQISFASSDLARILKAVKTKSTVVFYMLIDQPDLLYIRTYGSNTTDATTMSLKVHTDVQALEIEPPDKFDYLHVIPGLEFYKMCKDTYAVGSVDPTTVCTIESNLSHLLIRWIDDHRGIPRAITLTSSQHIFEHDHIVEATNYYYSNKIIFDIMKVGQLCNLIKIYISMNGYIRITSSIGWMGTLNLYIRANKG